MWTWSATIALMSRWLTCVVNCCTNASEAANIGISWLSPANTSSMLLLPGRKRNVTFDIDIYLLYRLLNLAARNLWNFSLTKKDLNRKEARSRDFQLYLYYIYCSHIYLVMKSALTETTKSSIFIESTFLSLSSVNQEPSILTTRRNGQKKKNQNT